MEQNEREKLWAMVESNLPLVLMRPDYQWLPEYLRPSNEQLQLFARESFAKLRNWAMQWTPIPEDKYINLSAKQQVDVFKILLLREVRKLRNEWLKPFVQRSFTRAEELIGGQYGNQNN